MTSIVSVHLGKSIVKENLSVIAADFKAETGSVKWYYREQYEKLHHKSKLCENCRFEI